MDTDLCGELSHNLTKLATRGAVDPPLYGACGAAALVTGDTNRAEETAPPRAMIPGVHQVALGRC